MKKITAISLIVVLFFAVATTYASVQVVSLFAGKFTRTAGVPDHFEASFGGVAGPGVLVIKNGDESGTNRVSAAIIKINGKQVLGTSSFNQRVPGMTLPISLNEMNLLSLDLVSAPGSSLGIEVTQAQEVPELHWLSCTEGDPAIPGDGITIASDWFHLSTPVRYSDLADGFDLMAFPGGSGAPPLFQVQLGVSNLMDSGPCQISFQAQYATDTTPLWAPTTSITLNGVLGVSQHVSTEYLMTVLEWLNSVAPSGCGTLTLNDLFLDRIGLQTDPSNWWYGLDAAALSH
jgi:hypothetical protein